MSNMLILGAGDLWAKPSTGTPVRIATAKKITVNLAKESIDEHGAYEFPLDTAGGKATCKGKITIAGFETGLVQALYSGATVAAGYDCMFVDEAAMMNAATYDFTVTNVTGGITDYGLLYAATGLPLTKITAGTPTTGQYKVDETTGKYTCSAADAGDSTKKNVLASYSNAVAATGTTVDIKSALIGSAPAYLLQGWNVYSGKKIGYRFPTVKFTGLNFELTTEKHTDSEYDFSATALPGQTVMKMFFA